MTTPTARLAMVTVDGARLDGRARQAQPGADRWRVLLDPAGHPSRLTLAANRG